MDQKINKVCGIDVHKLFVFTAIMISGMEEPIIKRFSTDGNGLLELRNWLKENDVERVAMESTGIYWGIVYWQLAGLFQDDPCKCERNPRSQAGTEKDRQEGLYLYIKAMFKQYRINIEPPSPVIR